MTSQNFCRHVAITCPSPAKSWAGHAAYRQPPSWEKPRAGERGKKINGKSMEIEFFSHWFFSHWFWISIYGKILGNLTKFCGFLKWSTPKSSRIGYRCYSRKPLVVPTVPSPQHPRLSASVIQNVVLCDPWNLYQLCLLISMSICIFIFIFIYI